MFYTSAAWYLHARNGKTFYVVIRYNCGEFFGIVAFVEFGTADERYMVSYKFVVKIAVGLGGAVRRNKQLCSVKIRSVDRYEFDLYGPLRKTAVHACCGSG